MVTDYRRRCDERTAPSRNERSAFDQRRLAEDIEAAHGLLEPVGIREPDRSCHPGADRVLPSLIDGDVGCIRVGPVMRVPGRIQQTEEPRKASLALGKHG